jgi:hypothetical protein
MDGSWRLRPLRSHERFHTVDRSENPHAGGLFTLRQHGSMFPTTEEHAPVIFVGEKQRSDIALQVPHILRGRPVYCLSLLGQDAQGRDVVDTSAPRIEDIADRLLPQVRALIAPGPVHLVA